MQKICGYDQQSVRNLEEKQSFYEWKSEWDMNSVDNLVLCMGNFNGHMGRHIDGLHWVYGGNGEGQKNLNRRMLLVLPGERNMNIKCMAKERGEEEGDIKNWRK